jgi:hypothetical protein
MPAEVVISFCCPECYEMENLEPVEEIIKSLDDLIIICHSCGYKGMPRTFFMDCSEEKEKVKH